MAPKHALLRLVPMTKESLVEWAEHLFRYVFRTQVRVGAFMPLHRVEQNIFIVGMFQCFGRGLNQGNALASVAAFFSVTGMVEVFPGAPVAIMVLTGEYGSW